MEYVQKKLQLVRQNLNPQLKEQLEKLYTQFVVKEQIESKRRKIEHLLKDPEL